MAAPRVIRQSWGTRLAVRVVCAGVCVPVVAVMVVLPRQVAPHAWLDWTVLSGTLAFLALAPLRFSRLAVRLTRDELVVRNSLSTRRLKRSQVAAIRSGPAPAARGGLHSPRHSAYAVLHSGEEVRLEALGQRFRGVGAWSRWSPSSRRGCVRPEAAVPDRQAKDLWVPGPM